MTLARSDLMAHPASAPHQSPAQALAALLQDRSLGLRLANEGAETEVVDPAALQVHLCDSRSGFRSVSERIWSAAERGERGFVVCLLPADFSASVTGLQHQLDIGHLAVSGMRCGHAYQLASGAELDAVIRHGVRHMVHEPQGFYYLTVEDSGRQVASLSAAERDGAVRGIYRLHAGQGSSRRRVQLLGSGGSIQSVLEAAKVLEAEHATATDIWYVTSYQELARDGMPAASSSASGSGRHAAASVNWFAGQMAKTSGPVIAVSAHSRLLPELIRPLVPHGRSFRTLNTEDQMEDVAGLSRSVRSARRAEIIVRVAHEELAASMTQERAREDRRSASILSTACI